MCDFIVEMLIELTLVGYYALHIVLDLVLGHSEQDFLLLFKADFARYELGQCFLLGCQTCPVFIVNTVIARWWRRFHTFADLVIPLGGLLFINDCTMLIAHYWQNVPVLTRATILVVIFVICLILFAIDSNLRCDSFMDWLLFLLLVLCLVLIDKNLNGVFLGLLDSKFGQGVCNLADLACFDVIIQLIVVYVFVRVQHILRTRRLYLLLCQIHF